MLSPQDALIAHQKKMREQELELLMHNRELEKSLISSLVEEKKKNDPNWFSGYITDKEVKEILHLCLVEEKTFIVAKETIATKYNKPLGWVKKAKGHKGQLTSALNSTLGMTKELATLLTLTEERGTLNLSKVETGMSSGIKTLRKQIELGMDIMNTNKELTTMRLKMAKMEAELTELKSRVTTQEKKVVKIEECAVVIKDVSDWKEAALKLKLEGVKVNDIVNAVGISRSKVSAYLNQPEVKVLWAK